MASAGLLLQLTIILITVEGAFTDFVNVECIENQRAQVGQETLLKCVVKASPEAENLIRIIGVQWQKRPWGSSEWGTVLEVQEEKQSASEGYSLADPLWRSGKKNMSLLISNTAVKHDGVYRCAVATSAGNGECPSVDLTVTGKLLPLHHSSTCVWRNPLLKMVRIPALCALLLTLRIVK